MRTMKKRLFHQMLSIILCIVLVLGYTPVSVSADTGIVYGEEGVTYVDENGETQICGSSTEVTADDTVWGAEGTTSWYVVTEEVVIGSVERNQRITVKGDVHLILADGASLTVNGGIGLADAESNITIYGQTEGSGELMVQNVKGYNAGIGSNEKGNAGSIGIHGGKITVAAGSLAAGIGAANDKAGCGDITITGGSITAIGGTWGAGIGSGNYYSSCGNITITGGCITTTAGEEGAGIGTGASSSCGNITITGGSITAIAGAQGTGIGAGRLSNCEVITIHGGEMTAIGGESGAGIGCGYYAVCETIEISGGEITATGGNRGAGIGCGEGSSSSCELIEISGGNIIATGGNRGAGIGNGSSSSCELIEISGGNITATGGEYAAGIGNSEFGVANLIVLDGNAVVYVDSMVGTEISIENGIWFKEDNGTVYGSVTLCGNFGILEEQTLTIGENALLTISDSGVFTNNGTVTNNGIFTNNGTVTNTGAFVNNGSIDDKGTVVSCTNHFENDSVCSDVMKLCELCNAEMEEIHPHTGEYFVEENVISVNTCTSNAANCIYEKGTLTLTVEDSVYTGTLYKGAKISTHNFPVSENDITIVYYDDNNDTIDGVPTKAGTYTAKIIIGNAIVEESFVISKAEYKELTVNMVDYIYGEIVSEPTLFEMPSEVSSIEYYYNTTNSIVGGTNYQELTGTTLEPGTYYMYAVIGETENYLAYTTEAVAFTVKTATLKTSITAENVTKAYDGKSHGITVTGTLPVGAVIRYGTEKGKYTLTESPAYTNAGIYTVYYQVTAKGYNAVEGSAIIQIEKAARTAVAVKMADYTYNGTVGTPSLSAEVSENADVVYYYNTENKNTDGTKWANITATTLEPGTYYMYAVVSETVNYKAYITVPVAFTISKATASSDIKAENVSCTYDGKSHGIAVTGTLPAGAVIRYGTEKGKYTLTESPAYTNKGTYTVYYQVIARGYNTVEGFATITIGVASIKNAKATLKATSYYYDGKSKKPGVTVKLNGKTLVNGTDYTVSYKNNKNIGKATVTITSKGNYKGTLTKSFTIKVKNGKTFTSGNNKYKVTSSSTVEFTGLKNSKKTTASVPKTVKYGGKTFNVTAIAKNAFKKNTKLKQVTIGENVKIIGTSAFYGCKNLKKIIIKSTKLTTVGKNTFKGIYAKAKIEVPKKKLSAYKKLLKNKGQGKKVTIEKIK